MRRGLLISFEGIDGAGKSSHLGWVPDWLRARGVQVVATREPGGTPLGERLRALLLAEPMLADTEALLMFAARSEHVARVIEPALAAGRWVVCDRFADATFAYQGAGRGLPAGRIEALRQWVHPHLQPDRTFLFDLPVPEAERRRAAARPADRFEREAQAFHERVRRGYLDRAQAAPERFVVLDSGQPREAVRARIESALAALLPPGEPPEAAGALARPDASGNA